MYIVWWLSHPMIDMCFISGGFPIRHTEMNIIIHISYQKCYHRSVLAQGDSFNITVWNLELCKEKTIIVPAGNG